MSRLLTLATGSSHDPLRLELMRAMPPMRRRSERVTLTPERFWQIAAHLPDETTREVCITLAATGMRVGELYACHPWHLDRDLARIAIPTLDDQKSDPLRRKDARTKTGGRVVHLAPALVPMARRVLSDGLDTGAEWLRVKWRQAARAARIPGARLHDLRHLHAQIAVTHHVPITVVRRQLGHASLAQTMHYADAGPAADAATVVASVLLATPKVTLQHETR